MKSQGNVKGVVAGGILAAGILLLIGAARYAAPGPVGRFQLGMRENDAYLVDTVTGQVWHSTNAEFSEPKLPGESSPARTAAPRTPTARTPRTPAVSMLAPAAPTPPSPPSFIGRWTLTHPTEGKLGIEILPDGKATLREDNQSWTGQWHAEGDRITITTEEDTIRGRLDAQGRLLVTEGASEPIPFERAP